MSHPSGIELLLRMHELLVMKQPFAALQLQVP
jgi:hypothetical protein